MCPCVLASALAQLGAAWHGDCKEGEGCGKVEAKLCSPDVEAPSFCKASKIMRGAYDILYQRGASVILTGHDHNYEQFARHKPSGEVDPEKGVRAFVVGTGGFKLYDDKFDNRWPFPLAEVYDHKAHGVLRIDLYRERYRWTFVPIKGGPTISLKVGEVMLDNDTCNQRPPD
jgi:hypothetical protein